LKPEWLLRRLSSILDLFIALTVTNVLLRRQRDSESFQTFAFQMDSLGPMLMLDGSVSVPTGLIDLDIQLARRKYTHSFVALSLVLFKVFCRVWMEA
jgi:hypothetical protein